MGLFGSVFSMAESAMGPALIAAALEKTDLGGLQGIMTRLEQGGLGDLVASWRSGEAAPITVEQLQSVLAEEHVRQLARHVGIDPDAVLAFIAKNLPQAAANAATDPVPAQD